MPTLLQYIQTFILAGSTVTGISYLGNTVNPLDQFTNASKKQEPPKIQPQETKTKKGLSLVHNIDL